MNMFCWMCVIALGISAIGFYKYIYFISLGYGFSVMGIGAALLIRFGHVSLPTTLACILLILYGIRLGGFLLLREVISANYRSHIKGEVKDGKSVSFGVKCAIWISCALLYVLQTSPLLYRLQNGASADICIWIGVVVMVCGLTLESAADLQKNALKKKNPKRFCDTGLFRIVRCPNYLGEMIFWTGMFIGGISALRGVLQWVLALLGYIGIIYIMFSGARRLELRQNRNYGKDPEYQKYVKTVPILIPFVPLYSVEKYDFLVG